MSTLLSSAHGKVMIAGEYAVLLGQRALVAGIDRLAHCRYQPGPDSFWSNTGDGFSLNKHSALYLAVKNSCQQAGLSLFPGQYYLDTSDFFSHGSKLGLGSSAAAVVALSKIAFLQHELSDQERLFNLADQAHRAFNSPHGSGVDIAAALRGGLICFSKSLPLGFHYDLSGLWPLISIVSSGQSQSTADFLEPFWHFSQQEPEFIKYFASQSELIVSQLIAQPSSFLSVKESLIRLYALLDQLGQKLAIPIISPEHKLIAKLADTCGGAAKPSGAGGGDIAIAVIDALRQAEFESLLNSHGFGLVK